MEDDSASPPPRRQDPNARSNSSINWRVRDDNPRADASQQTRGGRRDYGEQGGQQPRGGYGQGRREYNSEYRPREPREPREIPGKPESSRLYVGNLLYTASSADITNFFVDNGFNVANVSMSIDPATGRNPSYCFVDLDSVEEATRAMEQLNGAEVLGRQARINPGVARKEGQSGPRRGYGSNTGERAWRDGPANEGSSENLATRDRWTPRSSNTDTRPPAESSKRLYIGGLPPLDPSAVEAEITALFTRAEPAIELSSVSNLIAPHASKANDPGDHHYLFVDLKNEADADRAIDLFQDADSPWSEGQRLRVNRAREGRERPERRNPGFGGYSRGGGEGGGYSRGGEGGGSGPTRSFGRPSWRTDNAE